VWGDRDDLCPHQDQRALAEAIPGADLVVYPGGGHAVHWEQPARVAADLVALTTKLEEKAAFAPSRGRIGVGKERLDLSGPVQDAPGVPHEGDD
jgi:hypothetical protein